MGDPCQCYALVFMPMLCIGLCANAVHWSCDTKLDCQTSLKCKTHTQLWTYPSSPSLSLPSFIADCALTLFFFLRSDLGPSFWAGHLVAALPRYTLPKSNLKSCLALTSKAVHASFAVPLFEVFALQSQPNCSCQKSWLAHTSVLS